MPLGKNIRYRTKGKGKNRVRLAFKNNKVVEVKKGDKKAKLTEAGKRLRKSL